MSHRLDELTARIETLESELAQLKTLAAQLAATTESGPAQSQDTPSASRRDLLRYGAAALGAAAGMAASPAEAATGDPLILGRTDNFASINTHLYTSGGNTSFAAHSEGSNGLVGSSNTGVGVHGITGNGVTTNYVGGVIGYSGGFTGNAPGVWGGAESSDAPAVLAQHPRGGNALRAEVMAVSSDNAIALYALNYSAYTGGAPGAGGFAIYGLSAKGHGLVGATASPGGAAVVGATNGVAGAYAGAFYGPLIVSGNFTVVGGAKSAAVPHPDGSHRRLYCVESPESWFEDFGEAALVCGEASIALDPDFAAVVDTKRYHVFLTGQDGRCDLSVSDKTPSAFRVKAATSGDGIFAWRVVARRKDITAPRFEPVEIPKEPPAPAVPASVYSELPKPPKIHPPIGGPSQRPKRKA